MRALVKLDSFCLMLPQKSETHHKAITINYLSAGLIPLLKSKKQNLPVPWTPSTRISILLNNSEGEGILVPHAVITETEENATWDMNTQTANYLPSPCLLCLLQKNIEKSSQNCNFGWLKLLKQDLPLYHLNLPDILNYQSLDENESANLCKANL